MAMRSTAFTVLLSCAVVCQAAPEIDPRVYSNIPQEMLSWIIKRSETKYKGAVESIKCQEPCRNEEKYSSIRVTMVPKQKDEDTYVFTEISVWPDPVMTQPDAQPIELDHSGTYATDEWPIVTERDRFHLQGRTAFIGLENDLSHAEADLILQKITSGPLLYTPACYSRDGLTGACLAQEPDPAPLDAQDIERMGISKSKNGRIVWLETRDPGQLNLYWRFRERDDRYEFIGKAHPLPDEGRVT
ncbi:MAG: hypothetical protein K2Y51_03130 [Gammaproteobacteria bacterium]|nr:hypothetical protein [Gammaproteobacteria bacterium]